MSSSSFTEAWLPGPSSSVFSSSSQTQSKFYTRTWHAASQNPRALVVFVHGFAEHIARYEHVFPLCAQKDITVFAFDQRGFGRTAIGESSSGKEYGRTSWEDQFRDIEWALNYAKDNYGVGHIPLFLFGHSMGGGLVCGLATRQPARGIVASLSGAIVSSPLIHQTKPAPKITVWLGTLAGKVLPGKLISAPVNPSDLSHDPEVGKRYLEDPLVHQQGSLRGIGDMLSGGMELLSNNYQYWPPTLPALFIHGDADQVSSCTATQQFCSKIPAKDKKMRSFTGGYHELMNEPDGVLEEFTHEVITWIEARLSFDRSTTPNLPQVVVTAASPTAKL